MRARVLLMTLAVAGTARGEIQLNPSFSDAWAPTVVAAPRGEFLILYSDDFSWKTVARVTRDLQVVFGPATVTVGSHGPDGHDIQSNGAAIGWLYADGANTNPPQSGIYFHLMDFEGKIIGNEVEVAPTSTLVPCCVDLVWAEGEFTAVYVRESFQGASESLAVRRISAAGQVISPEVVVWPPTAGVIVTLPQVARVGGAIGVFHSYNADSLWGTWIDTQGSTLVPPREYVPQSGSLLMAPLEAYGTPSHASVFYWLGEAYEVHITPAGTIALAPQQIIERPGGDEAISPSPGGRGVAFLSGLDTYLRRTNDDITTPSDESMIVSTADPPTSSRGGTSVAFGHRAYGVAWEDDRNGPTSFDKDVFFQTAPAYELTAVGAGPAPGNAPRVKLWRPELAASGAAHTTITPYGAPGYGANVGAGDVTGDDVDEVLTGPGPGASFGPQVRAFSWQGAPLQKVNFYAYGTLKYGVKAQGAMLDGDLAWEMLTAPGPGAVFGPHVRGFNHDNAQVQAMAKVSFYAYGTLKYGANVAAGSIDLDSFDEVLTGPGPGAVFSTQLRGFDYDGTSVRSIAKVNAVIFPGLTHGLHVSAGSCDGDGAAEIGTAPGPGPASQSLVALHDYDGTALAPKPSTPFDAMGSLYGAQLSFCSWSDPNVARELQVSRGADPSSDSEVRVFEYRLWPQPLGSFIPYPGQTHGATLASVFPGF